MTRKPSATALALADSLGQIPSVTEILAATGLGPNYNGVPLAILERKRLLGSALHLAVHYDAEGTLDESSLHPEITEDVALWRQFLAESGYTVTHSEIELIHPRWRFKGHPDVVCLLPGSEGHAILDVKRVASVDAEAVARQLAAYRLLVTDVLGVPVAKCAALQINGGRYRYHDLTKLALAGAQTFLAALLVHQARQRRRT